MRLRPFVLVCAFALGAAAIGSSGCRGATEVTLEVSTDAPCPPSESVGVAVGPLPEMDDRPFSSTSQCSGSTRVGTLVVVPSGSEDEEIDFRIVLGVDTPTESCAATNGYKGCIVARRALRYIAHSQIVLPVTLTADCENVPCDASSTCVNGACVSSSIDPTSCPGLVCSSAQLGTGVVSDGGTLDATTTDASDGATHDTSTDAPPATCTTPCVASFAPGEMHTCAVHAGAIECWGDDTSYQLGQSVDGGQNNAPVSVPSESMTPFTTAVGVTSGALNACATLPNGAAQCWGNSTEGELGQLANLSSATTIPSFANAHQLAFEYNDSCWRDSNDGVSCLGSTYEGALGNGVVTTGNVAAAFALGITATQLVTGPRGACAVRSSDSAWVCWGNNLYGALDPSMSAVSALATPSVVTMPAGATARALGAKSSCAIVAGGQVKCWGDDDQGQIGLDPPQEGTFAPTTIMTTSSGPLTGATQITVASDPIESTEFQAHACALVTGGTVYCWGGNTYGQLGRGDETQGNPDPYAAAVVGIPPVAVVLAGAHHTCASTTDGHLYCWGRNSDGQIGDPNDLDPHGQAFEVF